MALPMIYSGPDLADGAVKGATRLPASLWPRSSRIIPCRISPDAGSSNPARGGMNAATSCGTGAKPAFAIREFTSSPARDFKKS